MNELLAAYRSVSNNWNQIHASGVCGCCTCVQIFPPEEIVAWTGLHFDDVDDPAAIAGQTALCPRCGSESVIGDRSGFPIDAHFLTRMNEAWFQRTVVRRPAQRT